MFNRFRIAMGLAFIATLTSSMNAFAKGGFDFITITGPERKEELKITDSNLTEDFFAFANFSEDKTRAPADPGIGYEITRHYVQGAGDVIFDRLHYYPETGFVFYDGIENGESEYDGEWYTANPEIKAGFESAIGISSGASVQETKSDASAVQAASPAAVPMPPLILLAVMGIAVLALFVYRLRRVSVH